MKLQSKYLTPTSVNLYSMSDDANDNPNKQGFDLAPDLDEIDNLSGQDVNSQGDLEPADSHKKEAMKEYREQLFQGKESKMDKVTAAKRLRECKEYNYLVFLPDEPFTIIWNTIMLIVYIIFYIFNPYRLAFTEWDNPAWIAIDLIWDLFFLIDIILMFFKAYYNDSFLLKDKRVDIARNYIYGWFLIDVIGILPLYYLHQTRDYYSLVKHMRILMLNKSLNLNKIFKSLNRYRCVRLFCKKVSFNVEAERLIGLVISFFLFCHLISCIWIIFSEIGEEGFVGWIESYGLSDRTEFQIYVISYYFIITTFSTVGYGDFSPQTSYERIATIFLEIGGIIFFSFAIGSLTTIIQKFNHHDGKLREKLDTLEDLKRECELGPGLYDISRQCLVYQSKEDQSEAIDLIKGLPRRLQIEISQYVLKSKVSGIKFFLDQPKEFQAFVIPRLKPRLTREGMFICREGDIAKNIYFLLHGKAGYAIEIEQPYIYVSIGEGEAFGYTDMIRTMSDKKGVLTRKFSILAIANCETVRLSLEDVRAMKEEFPKVYDQLFDKCQIKFKKISALKRKYVFKPTKSNYL